MVVGVAVNRIEDETWAMPDYGLAGRQFSLPISAKSNYDARPQMSSFDSIVRRTDLKIQFEPNGSSHRPIARQNH